MRFDLGLLLFGARIIGTGTGGQVETIQSGFRPVTGGPLNGQFDASEHQISLDEGEFAVTGLVMRDIDLSASPIDFVLDGLASLSVELAMIANGLATYDVSLSLPVDATEEVPLTASASATIDASGEVFATGQFMIPAPLAGDANSDGVVNAADYPILRDTDGDLVAWRQDFGQVQ